MAYGYKLQFVSVPTQQTFSPRSMSHSSSIICVSKVKSFVQEGAVKSVSRSQCKYISHIFPVPKKSLLDHRIIFDLTTLNLFIRKVHFQMDSISSIMSMIAPGDYLVSIDLSDAYHSVAMHPSSVPFLSFYLCGLFYQFLCLPQGLSSSPRVFTMLMRVVMTFLRSHSIKIGAWIADFILAAGSSDMVASHASFTIRTFEDLGFVPNIKKSHLTPVQRLCHLGLIWDTVSYSVSVPDEKLSAVQDKCRTALSSPVSIRFLSSILGSFEFFKWGFPYAALHFRSLQRFVSSHLSRGFSYDAVVTPSSSACADLEWWTRCGSSLPSRSLYPFSPSITVYTDSSPTGWGGWSSEGMETYGFWSLAETTVHMNILELKAVLFLFQSFFRTYSDCSVLIRSDNTTAVAYINNQGGTCSARLCSLALRLWEFCSARNISIHALHLPGKDNERADALSRMSCTDHSYFLPQSIFDAICSDLSFSLSVDYFASRLNFKLPSYVSWNSDPFSSQVNAFSSLWVEGAYIFPPLPLIDKALAKFRGDGVRHGLFITPFWSSRPWFSPLLHLLIDTPFLLPTGCVVDELGILPNHCRFLAWPIGCERRRQQEFLQTLPGLNLAVSRTAPFAPTRRIGETSVCGVVENKIVPLKLV